MGGKSARIRSTTLQLSEDKDSRHLNLKEHFHAAQLHHLIYCCNEGYVARWKDTEASTFKYPIQTSIAETD